MRPPLTRERFPAAVTVTPPALPVLPEFALLVMAVKLPPPCPSTAILSAPIMTEPALPADQVLDEITPPSMSDRFPAAVTSTLPALPLPAIASLEMPVKAALP